MEPNAPQNQPLDPSVVALTKSIAQAESGGNYNAPRGKDGEIGAYQMTPGFIGNYGPKYLGQFDPNNLTPEQQDKLAYSVVNEWGTKGNPAYPHLKALSPLEIASAWNSGDPHAYLEEHQGTSAGGAHYDTNKYVSNVQSEYEKLMGSSDGTSNPLGIPTANASDGSGNSSSGNTNFSSIATGGVLGGIGWLLSNAGGYLKQAIPDVATDALIGTAVEPGGGTLAGIGAGLAQPLIGGALKSIFGGGGDSSSGSSQSQT